MTANWHLKRQNRQGFSAMHGNQRKCSAPASTPVVSTIDQQTIPLQVRALREYATQRGWTIALFSGQPPPVSNSYYVVRAARLCG
jgi:hypothetical protein